MTPPETEPQSDTTPLIDLRRHDVARLRAVAEATDLSPYLLAEQVCEYVLGQASVAERLAASGNADETRARLHRYVKSLWSGDFEKRARAAANRFSRTDEPELPLEAYLSIFVFIDDVIVDTLVNALHEDPATLSVALRSYRRVTANDFLVFLGRRAEGLRAA
ncbi:MAG: hypothetical protein JHC95_12690 [Solirubrobacteraceae bacterium]|nr:hypothetical protein [Solirubrobacteraceae bacterium]